MALPCQHNSGQDDEHYQHREIMDCMDHREGLFAGAGLDLYYQCWTPGDDRQGVLIIVPGLGGHSGLYGHIVEYLIPRGYAIYSFDLRGNGRSPGQRGHIHAWSEYRDDLSAFCQWVRELEPGQPLFVLGHSVGAVVMLDYALRYPQEAAMLQGAIAFSPALGKMGVSPLKALLGRLLSQVWPRFSLHTCIHPSTASRDPAAVVANIEDTLRHDCASARFATEFFATVAWIHDHAPQWKLPLLLMHGEADQVALPEGGRLFLSRAGCLDKEGHEYPGAYHELQDDIHYLTVMQDLADWMERHRQ